jgi:hypothetical protein
MRKLLTSIAHVERCSGALRKQAREMHIGAVAALPPTCGGVAL